VGSEHPGERGWLGLRCPGFVGFQMAWEFWLGLNSTWDLSPGKMSGTRRDYGLPKGAERETERRGRRVWVGSGALVPLQSKNSIKIKVI
jgi:hypothetical protein